MTPIQAFVYSNGTAGALRLTVEPEGAEVAVAPGESIDVFVAAAVAGPGRAIEFEQRADGAVLYRRHGTVLSLFRDGEELDTSPGATGTALAAAADTSGARSMQRFNAKTVIVTGAGSGIGRGIAERFAAEGANVVLAGRTRATLSETARALDQNRTLVQTCDVARFEQVQQLVEAAVERFGGVDVMVNNAGVAPEGSATETSLEDWDQALATDLSGTFYGCKAALPHLLERRGCIVNIASVSGLGADWNLTAYNAAKGGVVNLTRALALDYGRQGVRINAVCPSLTRSAMTESMLADAELMARFMERLPLGRAAEPADIAAVVAFLASDDARFVNGVNLPVDGGLGASNGQPPM